MDEIQKYYYWGHMMPNSADLYYQWIKRIDGGDTPINALAITHLASLHQLFDHEWSGVDPIRRIHPKLHKRVFISHELHDFLMILETCGYHTPLYYQVAEKLLETKTIHASNLIMMYDILKFIIRKEIIGFDKLNGIWENAGNSDITKRRLSKGSYIGLIDYFCTREIGMIDKSIVDSLKTVTATFDTTGSLYLRWCSKHNIIHFF